MEPPQLLYSVTVTGWRHFRQAPEVLHIAALFVSSDRSTHAAVIDFSG